MALIAKVVVASTDDGQQGLFATRDIDSDGLILTFDGQILDHPTRYSVQIDEHRHIEGTEQSIAMVNHSCDANSYVDWDGLCLRAKRRIKAGEEITNNYLATDYELHEPFTCHCRSDECVGVIRGFRYLTVEQQLKLKPWLSPYLKSMMREG